MKDYEICYYNDKNVGDDEKHTHSYYEMYFSRGNASVLLRIGFINYGNVIS